MACHVSMRTQGRVPEPKGKQPPVMMCACNPSTGEGEIAGAHWSASLSLLVSPTFNERPCFIEIKWAAI